jgi:hypothetical protein
VSSRLKRRIYPLILLVASSACATALAQERTCKSDEAVVIRGAKALGEATRNTDVETLVSMMYPPMVEMAGGRKKLASATTASMAQMNAGDMRIEKIEFASPTPTYLDGRRSICFVPRDMVVSIKDIRVLAAGYLMAIWDPNGPRRWTYLDSDGFQRNPTLMRQLFPGLPEGVKPPPVYNERLK